MWTLALQLAIAAPPAKGCDPVPPEGFILAVGHGSGPLEQATRAAQQDARSRLIGQVCAGFTEGRCAALSRRVRDWTTGAYDDAGQTVCATAAVRREVVDAVEREAQLFRKEAAAAADALRAAAGSAKVGLAPARWGQGCAAGSAGRAATAPLVEALDGLVPVSDAEQKVQTTLDVTGDTISVRWALGGKEAVVFVAPDLLGLDAAAPRCDATDARPFPATGQVQGREETHWIGACDTHAVDMTALVAQGEGADPELARLATGLQEEMRQLCRDYERFAIDADRYGKRSAEITRWAEDTARALQAGRSGDAAGPAAMQKLSLTVRALRSTGEPLQSGAVVHARDTFELRASTSADAYVYVVYENSAGEWAVIPDATTPNRTSPGAEVALPMPGFEFVVDDQAGRTEVVHVLASPVPVPPEALAPERITRDFVARGLGVQKKPMGSASAATFYGDPEGTVAGYGGALYTLTLDHR